MENYSNVDSNILKDAADNNIPYGGKMFDAIKLFYDLKSGVNSKNQAILNFSKGNNVDGVKNLLDGANSANEIIKDVSKLKHESNEK